MDDRPIIFSAPLIRALLAGTKTQTRRLAWSGTPPKGYQTAGNETYRRATLWQNARPGDRLWVRETWHTHCMYDGDAPRDIPSDAPAWFAADDDSARPWGVVRSPIHMPRWASRLTLTVTDVRVQRVQDISAADAEAEGAGHAAGLTGGQAREAFALLWDSIHGAGAWERNPEVVALTFTVARGNIDAAGALLDGREHRAVPEGRGDA